MSDFQETDSREKTRNPLSVASVFGNPARQHDLDAILAIVPGDRPLPGTGGQLGVPGQAIAGYVSLRPLPIWCVGPVPKGDRVPTELIKRAIHEGLQLAELNGLSSVGMLVGDHLSMSGTWREMASLVVEAVLAYEPAGENLRDLRFFVSDPEVHSHVTGCLDGSLLGTDTRTGLDQGGRTASCGG